MLSAIDLIPENLDYDEYLSNFDFANILNEPYENIPKNASKKLVPPINLAVDPDNKIPFPTEFDDLIRLHYIACSRKVTTILEFGVGKSSLLFGNCLYLNKKKFHEYTSKNLRRGNLYQCHSIDNSQSWIDNCKKIIPKNLLDNNFNNFYLSNLVISDFCGRLCTFYDPLPNICPDLIYLDAPDQYSATSNLRGLSTRHQDRMPMSADILTFEHFLQPGCLIIVDGRTANARFLSCNLQRNWSYFYSKEWDQHFFELQEEPLGIFNKKMIDHCLGKSFYERLNKIIID